MARKPKPVRYNGVLYPSEMAAREATRVSNPTLHGITQPRRHGVVIDGVWYESQAAAARALGVSRQAINQRRNDPREGYDIDF